ncbi:MAG: translesion error-prone DNA polymerase V autoproteolytic subunit [Betaproteobacteria bacterium]|nr:translesion error-prone DNA polymerase V autoproteolytic subunit [Betaproteobacteria bacterium]
MTAATQINPAVTSLPEPLAQVAAPCEVPLLPTIAAGFPSPAGDYSVEEGLDLNQYLVNNPLSSYIFTVRGDSMVGAAILDGDKVVVDRARTPRHRDIVVAVVDNQYTIKRLYRKDRRIELHAENPDFSPIVFHEGMELVVWGVVTSVVRRILPGA